MDENKKIYYGYYKCRMCGREYYDFSCPDWETALDEIMRYRKDTTFHYHDNNDRGYADFIGFRYEEMR